MTSAASDPPANSGNVVPLRAAEAPTEVRLDEDKSPAAAYVDLTSGERQRRPLIPAHWSTWDNAKRHVALRSGWYAYWSAYHALRSPAYFARALGFAVWGVLTVLRRLVAWWHIPGTGALEREAAANGLLNDHLRIHKAARETRKARGTILALCMAVLAAAVVAMVAFSPWWGWAAAAAVLFVAFALAGRPQGTTITTKAELPAQVQPPDQDVITRALGSIGIAEINKVLRDGGSIGFPSPVREDGPGWRAEIDLPFGVTAAQVIDRRPQLASGLRRPLGAVWPEPVGSEHAGRLELWVGRADISKAKPPPWPLLRSGQADVFAELPFGTDVRGRTVKVPMAYHNWLIGSIPRQGKTAAVRVLTCGAALDPLAELWLHELKGSGDLDPLESSSHRFVSGIHDEAIGYAAESLKLLRAEVGRRTERLKALDRALCPDKRVTREIAAKRGLKLWPVVCVIDEAQNLFSHEKYGKQASDDATWLVKISPAFGVILILATQRPDSRSLPMGVSSNVSQRFCLKVMDQIANDMVLGTSAYKTGIRSTQFRAEVDAGLGYQIGAAAQAQVVRTYYLNMAATEKVAARARALREHAGTLSGVALGEDDAAPERDVLADVLEAMGSDSGIHWQPLADQLAARFPGRWLDTTGDAVSAECRARGVPSVDVRYSGAVRKGCRRADIERVMDREQR
jgi:S-DNA-T family DNA segregation ATPase FtsK/SpoIIIE